MSVPRAEQAAGDALGPVLDAYLAAILAPDGPRAWATIRDALAAGADPRALYLDVLAPAMVEVGRLWETARIGVAQEHLATQITQTVLARLAPELEEDPTALPGRTAVVAGTPGELHAIGARMVADFLEAAGWEVLFVGPDAPGADIVDLAARRRPDVVALSTALAANVLAAGRVFAALRRLQPPPLIAAGGRAYDGDRARALVAGADIYAADPSLLLAELALALDGPSAP
ncbi:cobalamin B12-binding domain-containing protein [Baekduia soli]|uniref:cobalamin B12-binding domain-containing protein n=1 Tax=Baekduia soli TaxID=496014 RepID=UPI00165278B1|nr:cobalamin-dependent protein [Baekduia soli]